MKQLNTRWFFLILALGALITLGACGKKATPPPPPPPPPAPAPTASMGVNPNTIQAGQSASLTWQTTNATGCIYRWYWCGSAKWVTKCFAVPIR